MIKIIIKICNIEYEITHTVALDNKTMELIKKENKVKICRDDKIIIKQKKLSKYLTIQLFSTKVRVIDIKNDDIIEIIGYHSKPLEMYNHLKSVRVVMNFINNKKFFYNEKY